MFLANMNIRDSVVLPCVLPRFATAAEMTAVGAHRDCGRDDVGRRALRDSGRDDGSGGRFARVEKTAVEGR